MIFVVHDSLIRVVFVLLFLVSISIELWLVLKIREIHLSMNSRLDRLLLTTAKEAHAVGMLEERERGVTREADHRRQDALNAAERKAGKDTTKC